MDTLYKGYVETNGKRSKEKLKDRTSWKTLEDVEDCPSYGGVLADDVVLIDIDDHDQAEKLMDIVEALQLNCKVYQTGRGKHFLFMNHHLDRNKTGTQLAIGITGDIKCGSRTSYEVIKIDGEERFCEWDKDPDEDYGELPAWLYPVRGTADFIGMDAGDGRNQAMFNYELTLQAAGLSIEECRDCIRLINKYILKEPLSDDELDRILRDEAFQKPVFFKENTFLFDVFAEYMRNNEHIIKINNQLHIYANGIYVNDPVLLSARMRKYIPNIKRTQKAEVTDCLMDICEETRPSDAKYIAFNNGILDVSEDTDKLIPFSPDFVITNKIPWNYNPDAYHSLMDVTLTKLACYDHSIRLLLEECVGYCFYRRNELGKAFILTGDKSNGKSTFLECIMTALGEENICALDLKELGDRFNTSMMYGKLADIGDDISDDFLQGNQVSIFKKIVTGNRIKAERKGQDPFEFNPYIKLLFSANDVPRMRDKTGAVLRRLVIIPFNNVFSKEDPDYDVYIIDKLTTPEAMEYLIQLGIKGLKRVLKNEDFTHSDQVDAEIAEYEEENNPILAFIEDVGEDGIINESVSDVYARYQVFCADNALSPMSKTSLSKQLKKRLELETVQHRIGTSNQKIFIKSTGV